MMGLIGAMVLEVGLAGFGGVRDGFGGGACGIWRWV